MKPQFLFVFLLSIGIYSCQNQNKKAESSSIDFIKTLEGEIGNYPIVMRLKSNSSQIEGNYYYSSNGKELELSGSFISKNSFELKEFDNQGNQTGYFEGTLDSENKLSGLWSKPNGDDLLDFVLISSNITYQPSSNSSPVKEGIVIDTETDLESISSSEGSSSPIIYSIDDLVGNWDIKLDAHESDCENVKKDSKLIENWIISYKNGEVIVTVKDSQTKINSYKGSYSGNVFQASKTVEQKRGIFNPEVYKSKVDFKLYLKDSDNLIGERTVLNPQPCKIKYIVTGKKK